MSTEIEQRRAEWAAGHNRTYTNEWARYFGTFEKMDGFPRIFEVGIQHTSSADYYCEGVFRTGEEECYFFYTLEGVGGFSDQNGQYRVTAGQGCLMEIFDPHIRYFYPPESQEQWRFLAVRLAGTATHEMVRDLVCEYGRIYTLHHDSAIIQRLLAYETPKYAFTRLHMVDATECVMELLLALDVAARAARNRDSSMELVQKAMRLMNANTDTRLTVRGLAEQLEISREHLSRLFQQCLGISPSQLLLEQKIRRACFLLKEDTMPIKQISERLGYTTSTSFTHSFRQAMQMTPHEFRQHGTIPLTKLPRI